MAIHAQAILDALQTVLPADKGPYPLSEPRFAGNEWEYVKECIDTGWVSSVGKYVDRFEQDIAQYTGASFAVATVNGTAALHISLMLAGVEADDEVMVPALSFVATTNAVSYCGALPHFVDSDRQRFGVDADSLADYLADIAVIKDGHCINKQTGRIIRALVVMHAFGHPADLDALTELCQRYHLQLVEDAAEALGSFYKGRHVGHHGLIGALSFNGNKIITTGGGGAIITDDAQLARHAKHLTTTAKLAHAWRFDHDEVGYNYRMPNLNAALGCAQLMQLPQLLFARRELTEIYQRALDPVAGVKVVTEPEDSKSNYWLHNLLLDIDDSDQRDEILQGCHEANILARPVWTLQNKLPMYQGAPCMPLAHAPQLAINLISLPSSAGIGGRG
ncbi:MAG: LegC family aminotransferase [Gammaproteobacteria bacterium]|nr:LegC family aminotransferase [Gammaproteobacteria bacterium]